VKNQQLGVEQYLSNIPITPQSNFLDISTAEDSHLINDLIYYMNYSLAIFGWPMQVVDDPCMLCCIYPYLKPSFGCGRKKRRKEVAASEADNVGDMKTCTDDGEKDSTGGEAQDQRDMQGTGRKQSMPGKLDDECDMPIILEDNCCGCNVASVERRLAAHNYEIIYVSYRVDVNIVPFLVAADHSKQSLVVAIRGSMSLSDMVTDMNGQIDKLPIDDCPDDWLSHRGITRAAKYVKTTLVKEKILERAFNCRPDLGSQDYNLILCGHSLGAGVAAILGILLRKQHPRLKAYLYSPPGGILSLPAVEYTKQFAIGIILGNDCVPRLGVAQLERLRYHILLSLKSSKKSTGKILAKALCPDCCFGGNKVEYDPSQSLNLLHGTGGRSFDFHGSKIPFQVQPQLLYVPGRLIHIVKNRTFKSKARRLFNEPIYQALWNDNTIYDRIMISEGMFYDHLPNNLMHAMKMLFSKTLPARKESRSSSDQHQPYTISDGVDQRMSEHVAKTNMLRNIIEGEKFQELMAKGPADNQELRVDVNNNGDRMSDLNTADHPRSEELVACVKGDHGEQLDCNGNDNTLADKNI